MEELHAAVYVATQEKHLSFKYNSTTTADELRTNICTELFITPVAKNLFSLQFADTKLFLEDNAYLQNNNTFNLRIRYRVPNLSRLKQLDPVAYNYYFHQVRKDVLDNSIPEILYSKYREELLGLGISDMYRVMVEERKSQQDIMKEYKKYIPREVTKKHSIFTKKPIYSTLDILQKKDLSPSFIIEKYMNQFDSMAPNYLSEEYKVIIDKNGILEESTVFVMPFHSDQPGLRISVDKLKRIEHLCTIGELCSITIRDDGTVELCRKNGMQAYLKFDTLSHMRSFTSLCDGYYRLMIKWTFNICKDMPTPHLIKLHGIKCHGPVGGVFSYHKLEEKRSNKAGCFILRQCEQSYDVYFIDVCNKHSLKPMTYKIKRVDNGYIFDENDSTIYTNILDIIGAYKNSEEDIYLQECLPPSEYDKSQLLLCRPYELNLSENINHGDLDSLLISNKGPLCINSKELQLYRGTRIEGSKRVSCFYKARWNVAQGKIMEVAMKMLKQDYSKDNLKDFIDYAGQWAFLKSAHVVRLYGITLRSPVAMVMELLPLGRLDLYLQNKRKSLQLVDLVEAATSLATALFYLDENGIVHGNIRCHKLLVSSHDSSKFTVKLSDKGLHSDYENNEIHWIPIEFYNNLPLARKSTSTDVWAFATTLWEIFSYGTSPDTISQSLTTRKYMNGSRLSIPPGCPDGIFSIMRDCWIADPHIRSRPQAIMRDVNKFIYQNFNSRRKHLYTSVSLNSASKIVSIEEDHLLAASEAYNDKYNLSTASTSLFDYQDDSTSYDISNQWSVDELQNIYEFEGYNVVLQGIIGQGFYGYVFKGMLQKDEECQMKDLKTVAVKKLKPNCQSDDFDHEIKIAKTLKHPNIVEIYGIVESPEILLIMEYIPHGSLTNYLQIKKSNITVTQLLKYALDVSLGMQYLETMQVVHRDLAARNILVVNENHVKITDFGLAREIDKGGYYLLKSDRALPLNWYAPESKISGKFSAKSDVWSYGVTLWEMFSFGTEPPQCDPVNDKKLFSRLSCPEFCPNEVYTTLMLACWQYEPIDRPTFRQLAQNCSNLLPYF